MSNIAIKVENLSKQYRLGEVGTGTVSHDLNRWWHRVRGKEDPYLKIGETNDRTKKGDSEYVWALQDINFEVQQGEILGIIGKNGAGKSTLLKILSKVTAPTTGAIKAKGRIASLLEVGTGFHPELSGRENIYLNGTILGMTKAEVKNKLDEIVDFAGVERYIDTPVKRYSSGMMVRLGFAVAAHLEPEILIVDEVLAVGDAEFQKKAIGKMQEVSQGQGRTVLFVSHNMGSIAQLCSKAILLYQGAVQNTGNVELIINSYLSLNKTPSKYYVDKNKIKNKDFYFKEISCIDDFNIETNSYNFNEHITIKMLIKADTITFNSVKVGVALLDRNETRVFSSIADLSSFDRKYDDILIYVKLPNSLFAPGNYSFLFALHILNQEIFDLVENTCSIKIYDNGTEFSSIEGFHYGNIIIKPDWYAQ